MGNRAPGTIWGLRPLGTYPNGYVRTDENDDIEIVHTESENCPTEFLVMSRRDARLLAKRINQCLDKTTR
jgi:hypothetical protein